MAEPTTPTEVEEVVDSGVVDTTLPEDQIEDPAVENDDDTTLEDETSSDSNDSTDKVEDESKADASLKKFAKGQGFDPENLSAGEIKALRLLKNRVSKERAELQDKSKGAVENNIKDVPKDSELSDRDFFEFRLKQRDMIDNVRQYWNDNPDDRQYEAEASALLLAEKEKYGQEAMFRLAENMPRLLREAKFNAGAFDTNAVSETAKREERQRLKKAQEGSADSMNATTGDQPSKSEDVQEWIRNEYDPSNPEHRKKINELTASRGKIY